MKDSSIRDYWCIIQSKDMADLSDPLLPLEHIENCLKHFNLDAIPLRAVRQESKSDILSREPSFAEVTEEVLLWLRLHLYAEKEMAMVAVWADKLMRFCEVRYKTLRKRSLDKCKNSWEAHLLMLHLTAFLLDYALYTRDIRFLNTALKLEDQRWIFNKKTISTRLSGDQKPIISGLFQFRILLVTEYAMDRLSKGSVL